MNINLVSIYLFFSIFDLFCPHWRITWDNDMKSTVLCLGLAVFLDSVENLRVSFLKTVLFGCYRVIDWERNFGFDSGFRSKFVFVAILQGSLIFFSSFLMLVFYYLAFYSFQHIRDFPVWPSLHQAKTPTNRERIRRMLYM